MQLDQATLDDLLIPSFSYTGDTLFDVDIVQRIVINFLQQDETDDHQVQELPELYPQLVCLNVYQVDYFSSMWRDYSLV